MRTFVTSVKNKNNGTINIDGYSSAKSVKAALADFGRYISRRYSVAEGKALAELEEKDLANIINIPGEWYCEVEEVSCASKYNEETDEMEYKDGFNYYVYVRFVAPEI